MSHVTVDIGTKGTALNLVNIYNKKVIKSIKMCNIADVSLTFCINLYSCLKFDIPGLNYIMIVIC